MFSIKIWKYRFSVTKEIYERDTLIYKLYTEEGLTQVQIAKRVGIKQARVSIILRRMRTVK